MLPDDTRNKIKNIVAGNVVEGSADHCAAIRNSLCSRFATSTTVKTGFESNAIIKEKQAALIEAYCAEHQLWLNGFPGSGRYLTRGGEARVYMHPDNRHVVKVNDAIYYATWLEFLNSVLLHNILFRNTSYVLLGFLKEESSLFAVLEQPFIVSDAQAELGDVSKHLAFNGFEHTRLTDYSHKELGLILEDMHDENVIVNSETLFFIDSVFYTITPIVL